MRKKIPSCALADLPAGCRAKVSRVECPGDVRARLLAMGLTPDTEVEVLDCSCGRQVVRVRGCSMILDGETACRITCALEPEAPEAREGVCRGFMRFAKKRRG